MEESNNLLAALQTMLKLEPSDVVKPSALSDPSPSTSSDRKWPHAFDQSTPSKKPRLDKTVRQSIGNTFSNFDIPVGTSRDLTVFLDQAKSDICGTIEKELVERKALKFYLSVNFELVRNSVDGAVTTKTPYLHSLPSVVLENADIDGEYQTASDWLKDLLNVFQREESGFTLKYVQECTVNIASYDVIGGSSFIELPAYIQNKKATVNIKNTDDEFCFCTVCRMW